MVNKVAVKRVSKEENSQKKHDAEMELGELELEILVLEAKETQIELEEFNRVMVEKEMELVRMEHYAERKAAELEAKETRFELNLAKARLIDFKRKVK